MLQQPRKKIETTNTYRTITATPRTEKIQQYRTKLQFKIIAFKCKHRQTYKIEKNI